MLKLQQIWRMTKFQDEVLWITKKFAPVVGAFWLCWKENEVEGIKDCSGQIVIEYTYV